MSPGDFRRYLRDRDWLAGTVDDSGEAWSRRQLRRLLEWRYGPGPAGALAPGLTAERSRRTGRLRRLLLDGRPAFVVGNDGLPRPTFVGGERLREALPPGRERVVVDEDAAPFVREGRSLFSRFVLGADPALVPEASALLVDGDDRLLAVGRLLLAPAEMGRLRRGVAAWVTSHARAEPTDDDEDTAGPEDGPIEGPG